MPISAVKAPDQAAERKRGDTAMVNVRMARSLKERGDAALAKAGFTPTSAVRAVWEFAADHEGEPEKVRRLLEPDAAGREDGPSAEELAERQRKREVVHRLAHMYEDFCKEQGLPRPPAPSRYDTASYGELRDEAIVERWREKGLIDEDDD